MAKPGFRILKDQDNGFEAFFNGARSLGHTRSKVGIQGQEAMETVGDEDGGFGSLTRVKLAVIHEFGAKVKNGFGRGIEIVIPERSFLRSTADENRRKYELVMKRSVRKLVKAPLFFNAKAELFQLGERVRADVIRKIKRRIPPPNKPSTIAQKKGEDVPLIDTGQLVGSISAVVARI